MVFKVGMNVSRKIKQDLMKVRVKYLTDLINQKIKVVLNVEYKFKIVLRSDRFNILFETFERIQMRLTFKIVIQFQQNLN